MNDGVQKVGAVAFETHHRDRCQRPRAQDLDRYAWYGWKLLSGIVSCQTDDGRGHLCAAVAEEHSQIENR